ncbi:MAG: lipopolysaccharide kinase InaA family protein [Candidatus Reddybacter sp.]
MLDEFEILHSYDERSANLAVGFDCSVVQWFKQSDKIKSGRCVVSLPEGDVSCFVKAYKTTLFKGLARRYFANKVKDIWGVHCELYAKGVSVPKPVALIRGRSERNNTEYIISEWLEDANDMRSPLSCEMVSSDESRGCFILQSARLLGSIHQLGIVHGDFKYANLMLSSTDKKLFSVDFDGAKKQSNKRLLAKDVARFLVSMAEADMSVEDRDGFLLEYAESVNVDVEAVAGRVEAPYKKIVDRHKIKYPDRY